MVSEDDILLIARQLLGRHGLAGAFAFAEARIAEMAAAGDAGGAEVWRRIRAELENQGDTPSAGNKAH